VNTRGTLNTGQRSLGRPTRTWEDNIKTDLRRMEWDGMNWIHVALGMNGCRDLVNTVINPPALEEISD
jgi:hypothetical protein